MYKKDMRLGFLKLLLWLGCGCPFYKKLQKLELDTLKDKEFPTNNSI